MGICPGFSGKPIKLVHGIVYQVWYMGLGNPEASELRGSLLFGVLWELGWLIGLGLYVVCGIFVVWTHHLGDIFSVSVTREPEDLDLIWIWLSSFVCFAS